MIYRFRRYLAARRVRLLEEDLAALRTAIGCVKDPEILAVLFCHREKTRSQLAKARASLTAFYPPGVRFTWGDA